MSSTHSVITMGISNMGFDSCPIPRLLQPTLTPGPLTMAAKEGSLSAMMELKLLKMQVQGVSCICQVVARVDLLQKITLSVKGNVMIQLKEVINTMVRLAFLIA